MMNPNIDAAVEGIRELRDRQLSLIESFETGGMRYSDIDGREDLTPGLVARWRGEVADLETLIAKWESQRSKDPSDDR